MSSNAGGDDDYYAMLGVPKGASKSDIKKAYFQKAKQCHPDTNAGDPAAAKKFAELSEAYEVLSDDNQRSAYDRFGRRAWTAAAATVPKASLAAAAASADFRALAASRAAGL